MPNTTLGWRRLVNATRYSIAGFRAAWINEEAFRQELILTLALLPAAFWLGRGPLEYALLIGSCLIVLITELLNSAVEALTDRVGTEQHELSGRAKDLGSAAVLLSLVLVVLIWGAIALDRFALNAAG